MVLHIKYVYLILIETGLKTMLALFSILYLKITKNVEKKICASLLCKIPVIKVVINSVQQQGNGVDCGVFAIVYAMSLAFGENRSLCSYNVPLMI